MGEACRAFDTPVTGGNVSFYNQNPDGAVYPTPTIGMVGILEDLNNKMTLGFRNAGDKIYLIGQSRNDLGSSEYLHKICGIEFSPAPYFDLKEEQALQNTIALLIEKRLVLSAHDTSEGGLIVTLLESAFVNNLGFNVSAAKQDIRKDAYWFGEAQSRVVVSVSTNKEAEFLKALGSHSYEFLGTVEEQEINVDKQSWGTIEDWKNLYENAIHNLLASHESEYALSAL